MVYNFRFYWMYKLIFQKLTHFHLPKWLGWAASKGPIPPKKYWYYFNSPKNVLLYILSFVFWISRPWTLQNNTISKSVFQDSFRHIFWTIRKIYHAFWTKATIIKCLWYLGFITLTLLSLLLTYPASVKWEKQTLCPTQLCTLEYVVGAVNGHIINMDSCS